MTERDEQPAWISKEMARQKEITKGFLDDLRDLGIDEETIAEIEKEDSHAE